jgi:hypothetical protein
MTAVEWLVQEIETGKIIILYSDKIHSIRCLPEFVKQALEMEKQQIMEAWHNGKINEQDFFSDHIGTIVRANCAEKYYNETYKPST